MVACWWDSGIATLPSIIHALVLAADVALRRTDTDYLGLCGGIVQYVIGWHWHCLWQPWDRLYDVRLEHMFTVPSDSCTHCIHGRDHKNVSLQGTADGASAKPCLR